MGLYRGWRGGGGGEGGSVTQSSLAARLYEDYAFMRVC